MACTTTVSSSMRLPSIPWIRLARSTSSSTGRSLEPSTSPCTGCFSRRSRPYLAIVSATSTSSACGTAYRLNFSSVSTTCSASCPAARAFHSPSGVSR